MSLRGLKRLASGTCACSSWLTEGDVRQGSHRSDPHSHQVHCQPSFTRQVMELLKTAIQTDLHYTKKYSTAVINVCSMQPVNNCCLLLLGKQE